MKYAVLTRIMNSAASLAETKEIEVENQAGVPPALNAYQKASLMWPDRGIEGVWPGEIGERRTRLVNEDKPRIVENGAALEGIRAMVEDLVRVGVRAANILDRIADALEMRNMLDAPAKKECEAATI